MGRFTAGINRSNAAAEAIMGEPFWFNNQQWMAVALDDLSTASERMPGGRFRESSIDLYVRRAVLLASGLTEGSVFECRQPWTGTTTRARFRVGTIHDTGDDTLRLECGPPGVKTPRL